MIKRENYCRSKDSFKPLANANTLGFVSMNTVMNSTNKGLHENCFVVSISSAHTVFFLLTRD